jgi:Leucine-rich repeat (LRR) protein
MKLFISAAVSLLLIGLTMSGTAYSQVSQIERDALVALYNSTNGANWTDNTGWMGAVGTECDWYGVTCSSGSVSRIGLYRNSLSGSIPAELGNLTKLTNISLDRNTLSGSIPTQLGNLTNLTTLDLLAPSL